MTNGSVHAFPHLAMSVGGPIELKGGLSKREYFAAKAMQALLISDPNKGRMPCDYENIEALAVEYADALLKELAKK